MCLYNFLRKTLHHFDFSIFTSGKHWHGSCDISIFKGGGGIDNIWQYMTISVQGQYNNLEMKYIQCPTVFSLLPLIFTSLALCWPLYQPQMINSYQVMVLTFLIGDAEGEQICQSRIFQETFPIPIKQHTKIPCDSRWSLFHYSRWRPKWPPKC